MHVLDLLEEREMSPYNEFQRLVKLFNAKA
jgi:hypothetical protein